MGQILENEPKPFDIFRHADLWVMVSPPRGQIQCSRGQKPGRADGVEGRKGG